MSDLFDTAPAPEPAPAAAPPRTPGRRTVRVLHLAYAFRQVERWEPMIIAITDPGEAERQAKFRRDDPQHYACISITGPHEQELPDQ